MSLSQLMQHISHDFLGFWVSVVLINEVIQGSEHMNVYELVGEAISGQTREGGLFVLANDFTAMVQSLWSFL